MTKSPVTFPSHPLKGAEREVTEEKQPRVKTEHGLVGGRVGKRTEKIRKKRKKNTLAQTGRERERKSS